MSNTGGAVNEELKAFVDDVLEQVTNIEPLLASWSSDEADPETIGKTFRFFHNVKGTAGMFNLPLVQEVFHVGENLLAVYREKGLTPDTEVIESLMNVIDEFKKITTYALENGVEPADKPYELMGRLLRAKQQAQSAGGDPNATANSSNNSSKGGEKKADESIRISPEDAGELVEIVSNFIQLQNRLDATLGTSGDSFTIKNDIRRFSSRLQNFVLSIRLAPIQPLLSGLQRVAMSAARETGKQVKIQIMGGDTQLDRRVLELLRDPLIHMIRNAIDHGIEKPNDRVEARKPAAGLVVVEAFQQAGQVIVSMSDDGKGMDPARIKSKAIEKGLITQEAADRLTQQEILNFIFLPGFSTAATVTSLSGRGVGMDAVKSAVSSIGGTVRVTSELGRGSKVILTLPLTLAIVKSLSFNIGNQLYAVPQMNVEEVITEVMARSQGRLAELEGSHRVLHMRKSVIPVVSMSKVLKVQPMAATSVFIVVKHRGERFALEVDRIAGTRDFVSQPLPDIYSPIDVIGGVNQLNSGEYIGLLDLTAIGRLVESVKNGQAHRDPGQSSERLNPSDVFRSQQKLVFFKSGKRFAVAVQAVYQVIQVNRQCVDGVGDKKFITYRGKTYPLLRFWKHFGELEYRQQEEYYVLLVQRGGKQAGILCEEFYGIHRLPSEFEVLIKSEGILGSINFDQTTYLVPNVFKVFEMEFPEDFKPLHHKGNSFNVLIAEDDPFFATCLSDFIKTHGMTATVCPDGLEAREMLEQSLKENSGVPSFDYVITDYEMPRMNGLEFLSWMRGHPSFQTLPVTMCTAVGDSMTRREAEKLGVDYFSGKMKYEEILIYLNKRKKQSAIGIVGELLDESHLHLASEGALEKRVLTFSIAGKIYGIEIEHLKEVSASSPSTAMPGAFDCIGNMIGFRGHPIPVLDLRKIIYKNNAAAKAALGKPEQIVAKFGEHLCALWVDHVSLVRRVKNMDRSSGVTRSTDTGDYLNGLIGGILWDQDLAITVLDATRIEAMLLKMRDRTKPLGAIESKAA